VRCRQTLEMGGQSGTWEEITALMRIVGQPFADTSLFAVDQIAAAMRQHVTVALSGDGGDEGFGGYDVYWQIAAINGLRWAPAFFWRAGVPFVAPLARLGVVRPTLARRMRDLAGDTRRAWASRRDFGVPPISCSLSNRRTRSRKRRLESRAEPLRGGSAVLGKVPENEVERQQHHHALVEPLP
jgi:asparagine synthetase B (glutamine-hydrolysing)